MTDLFGHRLSGSPQLNAAIRWASEEMKRDGLENVHTERVMVPHWVRGRESAQIVEPGHSEIAMLGLGDSVGTPSGGVQAELLVVRSFQELESKSSLARGRIVLFNAPFTTYDDSRPVRSNGPSRASRHGAVAVLVRSIGPPGLRLPHTGALQYSEDTAKIPAAAIATEDADRLQRMTDRGTRVTVRLQMEAHFEADAESANVVGDWRGRERPDEIVVVGGHIDSWDVGAGASDDGGGCVVTWEASPHEEAGLRPRRRSGGAVDQQRTVRAGFLSRSAPEELANHVMMLESDTGVFRQPDSASPKRSRARNRPCDCIASRCGGRHRISPSGGGSDIDQASARPGFRRCRRNCRRNFRPSHRATPWTRSIRRHGENDRGGCRNGLRHRGSASTPRKLAGHAILERCERPLSRLPWPRPFSCRLALPKRSRLRRVQPTLSRRWEDRKSRSLRPTSAR